MARRASSSRCSPGTDAVDGYLARSRNEVTTFGKFIDPLADKLLVTAALIGLVQLGELPAWIAILIISREFIVSGLRMVAVAEGKVVIAASNLGKLKTVTQIIAIVMFIVKGSPALVRAAGRDRRVVVRRARVGDDDRRARAHHLVDARLLLPRSRRARRPVEADRA